MPEPRKLPKIPECTHEHAYTPKASKMAWQSQQVTDFLSNPANHLTERKGFDHIMIFLMGDAAVDKRIGLVTHKLLELINHENPVVVAEAMAVMGVIMKSRNVADEFKQLVVPHLMQAFKANHDYMFRYNFARTVAPAGHLLSKVDRLIVRNFYTTEVLPRIRDGKIQRDIQINCVYDCAGLGMESLSFIRGVFDLNVNKIQKVAEARRKSGKLTGDITNEIFMLKVIPESLETVTRKLLRADFGSSEDASTRNNLRIFRDFLTELIENYPENMEREKAKLAEYRQSVERFIP